MYTHQKQLITAGVPLSTAQKAMVMIHGRGGTAADILSLQRFLNVEDFALVAPQATNSSWYPYSFMAPENQNQPALNSAIELIASVVDALVIQGIETNHIYFLGFSQGACLTLEYAARNAQQYGGIIAFTGGLIGEALVVDRYQGDFQHTPVLITTGNPDPHVPLARVKESVAVLEKLHAQVALKVYNGKTHSISREELELANELLVR